MHAACYSYTPLFSSYHPSRHYEFMTMWWWSGRMFPFREPTNRVHPSASPTSLLFWQPADRQTADRLTQTDHSNGTMTTVRDINWSLNDVGCAISLRLGKRMVRLTVRIPVIVTNIGSSYIYVLSAVPRIVQNAFRQMEKTMEGGRTLEALTYLLAPSFF